MKTSRKIMTLILAAVMLLAMGLTAYAQEAPTGQGGPASITVENAALGETYGIVKIFDATYNTETGSITYTGTIPTDLADYFTKTAGGGIVRADGKTDKQIADAVAAWAKTQTPLKTALSDGTALAFTGLQYGYYAVQTTQGSGIVTVDSTMPNAVVYDKNTTEPSAEKVVDKVSYSIGDTINYTATFQTANYMGSGENSKKVVEYVISDTLPPYLSNVVVDSIKIDGVAITTQQFTNKQITIPWVDNTDAKKHLYKNNAVIEIKYHATLTDTVNIAAPNTNRVTIKPYVETPTGKEPWDEEWEDTAEVKTYAAALHKVDENGDPLKGATFAFNGLQVTQTDPGVYTVVSYDPTSTTLGTTMSTDDNGKLYIIGLGSQVTLKGKEIDAPPGYNKLTDEFDLPAQGHHTTKIIKKSGKIYYDADGNVVDEEHKYSEQEETQNLNTLDGLALAIENDKGLELPSTGGMGTTIFYVLGALLVVIAGVVLVTRRRVHS